MDKKEMITILNVLRKAIMKEYETIEIFEDVTIRYNNGMQILSLYAGDKINFSKVEE